MSGKKRRRAMNTQISGGLPSGYQRVEYIESTGVQVFVIDYIINNKDTDIYIDYQSTLSAADKNLFGTGTGSKVPIRLRINNNSVLFAYFASNERHVTLGGDIFARHKISVGKYIVVDGVVSPFVLTDDQALEIENNESKIALFGLTGSIGFHGLTYIKMYDFKISEAGVDVVHLIPCYRKDDNVIGMYDVINDRFYQNEGSREFLKGEDVN